MSSDEKKLELLDSINDQFNKVEIIATLSSDEKKRKFLEDESYKDYEEDILYRANSTGYVTEKENIEIENDGSLIEYSKPLLYRCGEAKEKGEEERHRQIVRSYIAAEEQKKIDELTRENAEIQKQIQEARDKIKELRRRATLEASIENGKKELYQLLRELAELEADRDPFM